MEEKSFMKMQCIAHRRQTMRKSVLMMLFIALMANGLFAGGAPETKVELVDDNTTLNLVLMTKDSTTSAFPDWIKKVEAACNLKITVVPTPTNAGDRQAKVTTVLSTGDKSVDIITINDEMYTAFKETSWLEKLNDIMTPELIEQYPKAYLKDMVITSDGSLYSVPMYFSVLGWFVNTDIMKELGYTSLSTWEEFESFVKAATNAERFGYGDAWDPNYVFNSLGSFVNLYGGDYYDWANPKTQAGLHALVKLLKNGSTTTSQVADQYEQLYQNMVVGKRAVALLYTNQIAKLKKAGLFAPQGPIAMIVPPIADKTIGPTAYCSSWHYVLNAASPNKTVAKRFLKYAASEQGPFDYTQSFGTFPAYLSLLNDSRLDNLTGISEMREYENSVILHGRPIVPESMEYISEIGNLFHRLVLGQIDEAEFCKQAQTSTDKFSK
jgi:multiple sugar transport system substrate-binding protein